MRYLSVLLAACLAATAFADCNAPGCCYKDVGACRSHHVGGAEVCVRTAGSSGAKIYCDDKVKSTCNADCCSTSGFGVSC
ncbi:hypothetical protein EJ02DRAFT_460473 [Clathrospora elynae]|uniref:Uncharacterized protein n=1 Tax=Clathrospora elynae TaxID=706981 RepID=A0A6A5S7F7_9PLEO|nr:hypothetical protein EJ02DRAFT_460473 [Clathrospora elynae]